MPPISPPNRVQRSTPNGTLNYNEYIAANKNYDPLPANPAEKALQAAASDEEKTTIVKQYLQPGTSDRILSAIIDYISTKDDAYLEEMSKLQFDGDETILSKIVRSGDRNNHTDFVNRLCKINPAMVDKENDEEKTPIQSAFAVKAWDIVALLLTHNATTSKRFTTTDIEQLETAQLTKLLRAGLDPQTKPSGSSKTLDQEFIGEGGKLHSKKQSWLEAKKQAEIKDHDPRNQIRPDAGILHEGATAEKPHPDRQQIA